MRPFAASISMVAIVVGLAAAAVSREVGAQQGSSRRQVVNAEYEQWKTDLSNWGRWGNDDEMGALNLITPAKRVQAAALVTRGISVSLSHDAIMDPAVRSAGGGVPYERFMLEASATNAMDRLTINFHGGVVSHIDALGHRFFDGKMYNGFSWEEVTESDGARKNSIHNLKNGIFTRGILVDIPRFLGLPYLEPGARIYPEDLEAWEDMAGVRVSPGDAFFVRTGRWAREVEHGPVPRGTGNAGLDPSVIPWLRERDVAVLGGESPQDAPALGDMPRLAVHDFVLIMMGVHLFDNLDLDAVAERAAAEGRWEFLLTAAPLAVPGGTGSPLNPIATF